MSEVARETKFWKSLAPTGPWREFQYLTETKCEGKSLREFVDFWAAELGYSKSSVWSWLRGERSIPASAVRKAGIQVDIQARAVKIISSESNSGLLARQSAIDMMCNGCTLGDRFCRISDCPLRPFSPKPLHPKANPMGWNRVEAE